MSVLISVLGAGVLGALLGFLVWTVVVPKFLLTNKDYRIINNKFSDVWDEMQSVKGRVRKLEDAKDDDRCDDLSDIRASDMVMVKHPKKGWVKGCVMEKCLCAAFVVSDGECIWTDKVRKIEK